MDFSYLMFMADSENLFPEERESSIRASIAEFQQMKTNNIDPNAHIAETLAKHNLKEYNLTKSEIQRINREVNEYHG